MESNNHAIQNSAQANANADPDKPCDIDGNPIQFYGNPAHAAGAVFELRLWLERVGIYEYLFQHNECLLSNGLLAIDSFQAIPFIDGTVTDLVQYGYDRPCVSRHRQAHSELQFSRYDSHGGWNSDS